MLKYILLTFTLALCLFTQFSFATSTAFPQSVITYMATRQMRYHHYLWHQVRDNWNTFSQSTQQAFQEIGWAPPNPSKDSSGQHIKANHAGEEFLYMHRQMIQTANQIIQNNKDPYGSVKAWTSIPAPGDSTYPVPAPYPEGGDPQSLANYKTDDCYNKKIKPVEQQLKDYSRLKKMTLNDLGVEIESGIHNTMHMRWSGPSSVGYRGGGNIRNDVPNINKQWDNVNYNWLVDTYSSHVNPLFWSLHGWIDNRVEDWRKANGLTSIRWNGTWTGGPMSSLGSVMSKEIMNLRGGMGTQDPNAVGDVLEKALAIFLQSGIKESNPMNDGN